MHNSSKTRKRKQLQAILDQHPAAPANEATAKKAAKKKARKAL